MSPWPSRRVTDPSVRAMQAPQKAADELHLDADTQGVVVTDIADNGTAASIGFQKGDIILAVNSQKIAKTSDLEKAARESVRVWRIIMVRGGQQINVTLPG